VRKPSGKPQGLLNVSLKVGQLVKQPQGSPWAVPSLVQTDHYSKANDGSTTPMTAYPAAAVATGYPVGVGNQYNSQQRQSYSQPPPYTYQQAFATQKPAKTRRSGFGGAGFGTGWRRWWWWMRWRMRWWLRRLMNFISYHQQLIVQTLILRSHASISGCFVILQSDWPIWDIVHHIHYISSSEGVDLAGLHTLRWPNRIRWSLWVQIIRVLHMHWLAQKRSLVCTLL